MADMDQETMREVVDLLNGIVAYLQERDTEAGTQHPTLTPLVQRAERLARILHWQPDRS
jgi:hypothetical protein